MYCFPQGIYTHFLQTPDKKPYALGKVKGGEEMIQRRLTSTRTYMKSDWILWDPLAMDLNSTPSRSIS